MFGGDVANKAGAMIDKTKVAGESMVDAGLSADQLAAAVKGFATVGVLEQLQQWAIGAHAFGEAISGIDFGTADLAGGLSAMGLFNDMLFAQDNQIIKNEESFKALSESMKENGANFDVNTEAGRANQSALEGVARSLEDELAVAYQGANGDQEVFEQTAGRLAHDTLARLQQELGLSAEETFALGAELGLLPADLEVAVGEGATFNLAHDLGQMLYFRPHNRFAPGVYLVGGGTHPGSGLPVIYEGARITTRLLLKDLGLGEAASAMHLERMPLPAGMDAAA